MQLQCEHERVHIGAARHDDADDAFDTVNAVNCINCFYGIKQQLIVCVYGVYHVDHGW